MPLVSLLLSVLGRGASGTTYIRTHACNKSSASLWKDHHESCLLKSFSALWILTTFFSVEIRPLVVHVWNSNLGWVDILHHWGTGAGRPSIHPPPFRSFLFTCNGWILCPGLLLHPCSPAAPTPYPTMRAQNTDCCGGRKRGNCYRWGAVRARSHLIHQQQSLPCFCWLRDLNRMFQVKCTNTLELKSIVSILTTPTPNPPPSSPRQGTLNPDHLITKITHTYTPTHPSSPNFSSHLSLWFLFSLCFRTRWEFSLHFYEFSYAFKKMFVIFYKTFIGVLPRGGF